MQKRGVVVDADDFAGVTSTYPEHPLTKVVPKVANVEELKQKRADDYRKAVYKNVEANDEAKKLYRGSSVDKTYIRSEFFKDNPRFTSIGQKKANDAVEARKAVNLTN